MTTSINTQVTGQLDQLSTDELVNIYNDYAIANGYEVIHNLDENTINELYDNPWQALYDSNHKAFNDNDYFFTYNGYGHMVTFSNEDDENSPISTSDIATWIEGDELFTEYNIEIDNSETLLEEIETAIRDDEGKLDALAAYLALPLEDEPTVLKYGYGGYEEYIIESLLEHISLDDDEQLQKYLEIVE